MIAYGLVYAFLAIVMGAIVFVVGTPWLTPKPRSYLPAIIVEPGRHIYIQYAGYA
jgi:hypothetical protein